MNWNELWMTVFGTTHWLGLDLGFWVSMAVVALIVVAMNAVFWGMIQTIQKSLINKRVEEVHFFRCILKNIANYIFQHSFCQIHIIFKICKRTLRLNHPELCCMSCSIGILCTESRTKCVYISKCLCKCLTVQLTTYC